LLLHGVTRRWQDLLPLFPALTLRWQVRALDFRGHGCSGRTPGRYHIIDYAQDAAAFLVSPPTGPAVIYGHSLGALVAMVLAARYPELVRALVLEDPPAPALLWNLGNSSFFSLFAGMKPFAGSRRPVCEIAAALADLRVSSHGMQLRLGEVRDAASLRFSARCLRDLDSEVLTPLLESRLLEGYDVEDVCRRIACPVLLLRADENCGGMLPRHDAEQLARPMKDCTLIDLPQTGHLLHWLATDMVSRLTVGFLESL
jgi:pimeloyl-ACP methyl ester carboxylesterase